ncbi:hypothetical protein ACRRTK_015052 [Alexandromys fortis]
MHRPESEWSRPQLRLLGTLRPQLRSLGTHRVAAMDQDEGLMAVDNIVTQFNTYEDFLDSQITTIDLYYLEDESLARQLVELGYRGTGEIVKREDFEARKAAIDIARLAERTQKKQSYALGTVPGSGATLQGLVTALEEFDDSVGGLRLKLQDHQLVHAESAYIGGPPPLLLTLSVS